MVAICEMYGWDYFTYIAQPEWFIKTITEKMKIDSIRQKQEEAKEKLKH